ncbi:hypothetical protein BJX63DRAFT_430095 [Aspergillus granulosus]|uniref:DUF6604 domain-containing protein n=1 Tax=Aspergillus granulosus TaxID=176169 RepID=A0ABR4HMK6_9EURO
MSLDFLTSSYLQYKADTDAVAKWLAATAKSCGFPIDSLEAPLTNTGRSKAPKRLQSKATKYSGDSACTPQTKKAPALSSKHTIALRDFVSLADYIAASTKPTVSVPASFVAVLDRAILFIGILEHVRQTLRPRMSSENVKDPLTQRPGDGSVESRIGSLANRFEGLDVHEPSEAFLQAPDVTIPISGDSGGADVEYEAERSSDFEEAYLAFRLLLQDLWKMQDVIKQTWEGYRLGHFDLVSTSLTTNCAIDFARHMEEEIQQLLDKHGGVMDILGKAYGTMCIHEGENAEARQQPGDPVNFRTYNIAESMFVPTYTLLSSFCDILDIRDKRQLLPYKAGFFGTYDRASSRSKKSARDRFQEDKLVLLEILSEFLFLHRLVPVPDPDEDEVTRGLRMMFDTHNIPLWLTFACQIFLDIHHALRESVDKGFHDLKSSAKVVEMSIKLNRNFHSKLRIKTWPKSNDTAFEALLEYITMWVDHDFTKQVKERHMIWNPSESFKLLKWHPLLCGTRAYNLKARYQDIAITFQGAWGSVMYSAHLYNALNQERLLSKPWVDMDLVLSWHDEIFVGDPPHSPENYIKRYSLSMGYSAASFARDRRQTGRVPESKTGPKGIQPAAPVSRMFFDRYVQGSGQIGFSESDLEQILTTAVWEEDDQDDGTFSMQRNSESKPKFKTKTPPKKLTLTSLLKTMRNTLQSEALEFTFDYLALHRTCWRMLRTLREACEPMLIKIHGPEYLENETQLPFVVGYIFMAAMGVDLLGKELAKKDEVVKSRIMITAAGVVESLVHTPAASLSAQFLAKQDYNVKFQVER